MAKKIWGDPSGSFIVCIDSYDNRILNGRFYPSSNDEQFPFNSTMEFLKCLESKLDSAQYPQSFCSGRAFQPNQLPSEATLQPSAPRCNGRIATFSLKILFRQNASWQGSLCWLENDQEVVFRSVLELLLLIDNALSL